MSNWLYKSNTSLLAAEILTRDFSNQSVHCSYYSCLQFIYHILFTQLNEEESDLNNGTRKNQYQNSLLKKLNGSPSHLGTHAWLQGELYNSLKSRNVDEAENIVISIFKISRVRIVAHYTNELIQINQAKDIHYKAKQVIQKLNKIY